MNTQILTAILSKDSKTATYKFALLRSMVQCVLDQSPHKKLLENGWVSYPYGLIIYYWVLYYYPIFSHHFFIPQKNGETPELKKRQTLAFRREFNKVINHYDGLGGLPQLRFDLIHGGIPCDIINDVSVLLNKIHETVKKYPMRHLGFSEFGRHNCLIYCEPGKLSCNSYYDLVATAGQIYIQPELHELLDKIGPLIVGEDSIIDGWANFTVKAARNADGVIPVHKEEVLSILTKSVQVPRDITQVKKILRGTDSDKIRCIWTGVRLSNKYHIDHAVPFSLWQNNNLWNLVPVKSSINLSKSDRIPSPKLINESSDRIKEVWKLYSGKFGKQFEQEIFEGLGTGLDNNMDDAIHALMNKSEYLIEKRGFQKFEPK